MFDFTVILTMHFHHFKTFAVNHLQNYPHIFACVQVIYCEKIPQSVMYLKIDSNYFNTTWSFVNRDTA